jgi:hypothetical protein
MFRDLRRGTAGGAERPGPEQEQGQTGYANFFHRLPL